MRGLPPEILMVPLPGHTFGHAGVARGDSTQTASDCDAVTSLNSVPVDRKSRLQNE
ncbi:glyoxylase-like metal-dependent hydrolase (beta-lactamase superfamily II) [Variovorax paradoxus]|nr:glyoxylase-like metal-dependent hydrolase (beta-lactamase superfamily II) [Variovorax paradoxus]